MAASEETSPLDYANPRDLPPPHTSVSIQVSDGDTVVVIPPVGQLRSIFTVLLSIVFFFWLGSVAVLGIVESHHDLAAYIVFGIAIAFLFASLCLTTWHIWRNARLPTIIRVNNESLLLVRPSLISGKRMWRVADIRPLSVSFGSPAINGRMLASLRVGTWVANNTIISNRDKAELLWVARAVNRAMGKEQ